MAKPRILLIDIETQPDLVWTWGVYEQNAIAVKQHWQIMSFAYKWLEDRYVKVKALCDYGDYRPGGDDRMLCRDIWNLLDQADIVIAHNGIDFDVKKINARFIFHNMTPPSPFRTVDTKRGLKSAANFSSNKLDWICKQLSVGSKTEKPDGFQMWLDCMDGDAKAWAKMKRYNKHDVELLEGLYNIISPWIKQPNANMWSDKPICPNPACMSTHLNSKGYAVSQHRRYQRWVCMSCGTPVRSVCSEKGEKAERVSMIGGTIA